MRLKPLKSLGSPSRHDKWAQSVLPCLFAVIFSATACGQATPTLDCSVDDNDPRQIIIASKNVALSQLNKATAWALYSHSRSSKTLTRLVITDTDIIASVDDTVRLILSGALTSDVDGISGIVATDKDVIQVKCNISLQAGQVTTKSPQFKAATGKTDSDIYFSGSYAATVGGGPTYSIDSFAGYMHAIGPKSDFWGKVGLYGQVTTKAGSTSPSPYSYLTFFVFQRVLAREGGWLGPFQTPYFNYRLAGGEFSQQGNNTNFVNSPVVTFPFRFATGSLGAIRPGLTVPHMTVFAGTEFVKTVSSALPRASWFTRGVLGSTFSSGYAPEK